MNNKDKNLKKSLQIANLFTSKGFVILDISKIEEGSMTLQRSSESGNTIHVDITPDGIYTTVQWTDISSFSLEHDPDRSSQELLEWVESKDFL